MSLEREYKFNTCLKTLWKTTVASRDSWDYGTRFALFMKQFKLPEDCRHNT